ncbi:hypothetical protein GKODMF_12390 [Candidatus Electrothrix gigas]
MNKNGRSLFIYGLILFLYGSLLFSSPAWSEKKNSTLEACRSLLQPVKTFPDSISAIDISIDGYLAVASGKEIYLSDNKQKFEPLGYSNDKKYYSETIRTVVFDPKGDWLAFSSKDRLCALPMKGVSRPLKCWQGSFNHIIRTITFSPDGKELAVGSDESIIRFWNIEKLKDYNEEDFSKLRRKQNLFRELKETLDGQCGTVNSISFSPDGKKLVAGYADCVTGWNVGDLKEEWLVNPSCSVAFVDFHADGHTVALLFNSDIEPIQLLDTENRNPIASQYVPNKKNCRLDRISSIAFINDDKIIAAGYADGKIRIFDSAQKKNDCLAGYTNRVTSITFDQKNNILYSGSEDGRLLSFDLLDIVTELKNIITEPKVITPDPDFFNLRRNTIIFLSAVLFLLLLRRKKNSNKQPKPPQNTEDKPLDQNLDDIPEYNSKPLYQNTVDIFVCCARADQYIWEEFKKNFAQAERNKIVHLHWYKKSSDLDQDTWEKEIQSRIIQFPVILLLISHNFFVSDWCTKEKEVALRKEKEGTVVIPILLRPASSKELEQSGIMNLQFPLGITEPLAEDNHVKEKLCATFAEKIMESIEHLLPDSHQQHKYADDK